VGIYSIKKYCIINADDLGLSRKTNEAIFSSYASGILTSASLLATCPGFDHAIKFIKKYSKLGIGVHLSVNLGSPVLKPSKIPQLVQRNGLLIPGYLYYMFHSDQKFLNQIEQEFSAQIERCLRANIPLDHLDSQSHVHMIPYIFPIIVRLAHRYHIPFIRIAREQIYRTGDLRTDSRPLLNLNIIKLVLLNTFSVKNAQYLARSHTPVRSTDAYFGVYHTGLMNEKVLRCIINMLGKGITEISIHPGNSTNKAIADFKQQRIHDFMVSPSRITELRCLQNKQLIRLLNASGIIRTTFNKVSL